MQLLSRTAALAILLCCSGCFRYAALVNLKPDGSGTLIVRLLTSEEIGGKAFPDGQVLTDADESSKVWEIKKLRSMRDSLAKHDFGEGVQLVKQTAIELKGWRGLQATYQFDDINKLRLSAMGSDEEKTDKKKDVSLGSKARPFQFAFKAGKESQLSVSFSSRDENSNAASDTAKDADPFAAAGLETPDAKATGATGALAMSLVKAVCRDARSSTVLQIDGEITETNARHRPKPTSILLWDFDATAFSESDVFEQAVIENWSFDRLVTERVPGLKSQAIDETLTVKFRSP